VRRRAILERVAPVALGLLALGCSGHDSSGPSNTVLFEHNAQFNGGRTVRWPTLPIRVFLGNGVALPEEVTAWTAATGGRVTFEFVPSAAGADITFGFRSGTDICGFTVVEWSDDGAIVAAEVRVSRSIYRGRFCVRTVTHETAHAIGFLSHTADGGLMDEDGGNGEITPPVIQFFRDLYALPPGTRITVGERRLAERRPGGRHAMTFIYPVRR
jgi:hypothetical protein